MSRSWHGAVGLAVLLLSARPTVSQTILPPDPQELPGSRPYEMVWANRVELAPPTIRFDELQGWTVTVENGAQATLQVTRAQNVWERPVTRLRYHGTGRGDSTPRVFLRPPHPVELPPQADSVDMWVYGNRWGWVNPPDTPAARIVLHLRNAADQARELHVDDVRWQEWWLMHKRLASDPTAGPATGSWSLEGVEIAGGWQAGWREIFLDSIRFYREELAPLKLARQPKRNLTLPAGQSAGINTGHGRLPFPTTENTILPMRLENSGANANLSGSHSVVMTGTVTRSTSYPTGAAPLVNLPNGPLEKHLLGYYGTDGSVVYSFDPTNGLSSLAAEFEGAPCGRLMDGARIHLKDDSREAAKLVSFKAGDGVQTAEYSDGTILKLQIWQRSLVVDVLNPTGEATELSFGQLTRLTEPRTIAVPYLTYGSGPRPCVLLSRSGTNHVFTSIWLDWYRSNGSEPYAAESAESNSARINGGVRYHPRTDGRRNPMFERLFITVSPVFEEVLPTVPNPVGLHAKDAVPRLWQESWGPENFEQQMKRGRMLRAYGIEQLIQCNHEIAWRDGGESFTLRLHAAPKKGGDAALQRYVAHQRGLGWLEGLYSNYTDYAPVNEFWTPDAVQRLSDGNWRSAWPRCWAEKPIKAVEFDALLAPQIKRKYKSNSAYTDVHTAVSPWGYNDYDARVPGAGTFAQTFYSYGQLLRNDSKVYGGPIFSEGYYHWLYAGLADGNYALMYDGRPLAKEPLLPVFDLYQIHSRECDIGMAWTAHFCDGIPDWRKPENLDRAIDRFLLHTLAYGHIGWLVEEEHGLDRTCRSYYMLQQVQARYGLKVPTRIAYWDGERLVSVSEALIRDLPRSRRQLFVAYPGGLELWLNDHPTENWACRPSFKPATDQIILPPSGWAAFTSDSSLSSYSSLSGSNRADYIRSAAYTYLDGRGHWFDTPEAGSDGGLAIRPLGANQVHVTHISGTAPFLIRRPYRTHGRCVSCAAFDVDGRELSPVDFADNGRETRIKPREKAVTYVLSFRGRTRIQPQ